MCATNALPGLTGNCRSVYFALLSLNNTTYWSEVFDVDFDYILAISKVDKDTYRRAMDLMNERGLFESYKKGINKYARATVSLKVLTEKPAGNAVGNTDSNAVGNTVSIAHNNKTIDNIQVLSTVLDDVEISRSEKIEKAIADFTGPEPPAEEKEKNCAKKEKKPPPAYSEVLLEDKLVNTETWRNAKEHYGIDDSTRESMFKIFYEQNLDRYAILYPTYQAMAQHFYNWVPVHQQKKNIQKLKQLTNGAKTTNPQYQDARTGRHAAMAGLDDLTAKSAEFLRKSAGQDYYGDLANEQL